MLGLLTYMIRVSQGQKAHTHWYKLTTLPPYCPHSCYSQRCSTRQLPFFAPFGVTEARKLSVITPDVSVRRN